jgi:hypothetical protein
MWLRPAIGEGEKFYAGIRMQDGEKVWGATPSNRCTDRGVVLKFQEIAIVPIELGRFAWIAVTTTRRFEAPLN